MNRKNILLTAILAVIVFSVFLFYKNKTKEVPLVDATQTTYQLNEEGLSFKYDNSQSGYELQEVPTVDSEKIRDIRFISYENLESEKHSPATEAYPEIRLSIYRNLDNTNLSDWIKSNPDKSNVSMIINNPEKELVSGATAFHYRTDGLYATDVYVISQNNLIYMASGSFIEESSKIHTDFKNWVSSFVFIPTNLPSSTSKINPQTACESALAYMTFPSGKEADQFVTDCVNGKHPEVIERYKKDLGLDGKTI